MLTSSDMNTRPLLFLAVLASACTATVDRQDMPQLRSTEHALSAARSAAETTEIDGFTQRVVTVGLYAPWEITWGPDGQLWVTERVGRRVSRVDPESGDRATALVLDDALQSAGQDGLLGMALHPQLLQGTDQDFIYLAYTYDADPEETLDRRLKIVRYTYDADSQMLGEPLELIAGLPASNDHNSGRLKYGPDDKLYYTIGDQGKNQYDNYCAPIRAQEVPTEREVADKDWSKYQGKILRLELDGSIPSDNPVIHGARSHIYSFGHRNAQGIEFGPDGKLYANEHGPKSDDEINLIEPGNNYGWPNVAGYQDDQAYAYSNWSASSPTPCASLEYSDFALPQSLPQQRETAWQDPAFTPPLLTFYTVQNDYNFMDPACAGAGSEYICWPTIAPSSLDVYLPGACGIPGWGKSLLVTSLKKGSVFRVGLSEDGSAVTDAGSALLANLDRYRDLAIAPDKRTLYVITDSDGETSGPTGGFTGILDHRGAILEFSYIPSDDDPCGELVQPTRR